MSYKKIDIDNSPGACTEFTIHLMFLSLVFFVNQFHGI